MTSPTREQLLASYDVTIPDLIAPGVRILLCGINPSLYSGWSGLHFGRPANRLWVVLHRAGLTPRRLGPEDTGELLAAGIGITNLVHRATARADEVSSAEIRAGVPHLKELAEEWKPSVVAILGLGAFRTAFEVPRAMPGEQPGGLGPSRLWALPNPSGLNAHYQVPELADLYGRLKDL